VDSEKQKSIVELLTRNGSEIIHGQKEYLYKPYFPMGKYVIITADPGTGKTKLVCAIAAKVTIGDSLCGIPCQHSGNVVFFSREDDADDIVTTFKSCGGDPGKLTVIAEDEKALDYLAKHPLYFSSPEVEAIISEKKPSLVVFDPMQKYTPPNVDTFRNNQTSAALSYVTKLAAKFNCVIAIITHNVKMKVGLSLQAQVNGSSDIVGGSRSALAVVPYPEARERGNNIVIHIKSNNKIGDAINYRIKSIEGDEDFATVEFIGLKDYRESDYIRAIKNKSGTGETEITDDDCVVITIRNLLNDNPLGFKIDKDTLQDSIYEYTGITTEIKIADVIDQYSDYLGKKHGIGLQKKNTTPSDIVRNGKTIQPQKKSQQVLVVRRNRTPTKTVDKK
jgi:hypothetical protein